MGTVNSNQPILEPDTAYMPVPRCDACRHWQVMSEHRWGQCDFLSRSDDGPQLGIYDDNATHDVAFHTIATQHDFGCVHFETKGGGVTCEHKWRRGTMRVEMTNHEDLPVRKFMDVEVTACVLCRRAM